MRVDLAGKGDPIPRVALPDAGAGDTPPQVFTLEDGVPFEKADWVTVGYNTFEVWCIGAAGGRGANDSPAISNHQDTHYELAPPEIWEEVLETYDETARNSGVTYYIYNDQQVTPRQLAELQNPSHMLSVMTFHDLYPSDSPFTGGGGGGGGLQYASGRLDDLPDLVPVAVGKVGADASPGQVEVNGLLDGVPSPGHTFAPSWFYRWPDPHPMFGPPQPGNDGGASSFGDVAMASGGKGGQPRTIWQDGVKVVSALGGEGGTGGQVTAGGGAEAGSDGSWDGSVGQGGGGGRGGSYIPAHYPQLPNPTVVEATPGGRGSFSYSDTTVYGVQQDRQPYSAFITALVVPGGGGGARLKGKEYGSRAPGSSPDGVVYLRLSKID